MNKWPVFSEKEVIVGKSGGKYWNLHLVDTDGIFC